MFFFFDFGEEDNSQQKRKVNAGIQVKNGKAFEFAIAKTYANYMEEKGLKVSLVKNSAIQVAQRFYFEFPETVQRRFDNAAYQTIDTMARIEPKLICRFSAKNNNDAVKHSRLGRALDFGEQWVGVPCSQQYWEDIKPIFDYYKTAA